MAKKGTTEMVGPMGQVVVKDEQVEGLKAKGWTVWERPAPPKPAARPKASKKSAEAEE